MRPISAGRYNTTLEIDEFCLRTSMGLLSAYGTFKVYVTYYYEPECKPLEDDPGAPEYVDIISAILKEDASFSNGDYFWTVGKGSDLMSYATDGQRYTIADMIISQGKQERYSDPDNYRPAPDERIRRELGFGFSEEYDRDAS